VNGYGHVQAAGKHRAPRFAVWTAAVLVLAAGAFVGTAITVGLLLVDWHLSARVSWAAAVTALLALAMSLSWARRLQMVNRAP
jgi:hypothetical protein